MRVRGPASAALVVLVLATGACTSSPERPIPPLTASPRPTPTVAPSTPSATSTPKAARFRARNAIAIIEQIVELGPRETTSAAYRRASALVAERLDALGYDVRFQAFDVSAGAVDGMPAPAGRTRNVIAEPPGFDPAAAHLVVGGHLDSVPDSPGANDNASGIGVMLELARLARREPPRMPVVFVAFGAEERRRQSPTRSEIFLGAQAYLDDQSASRASGLRGMINLDMVGNGDEVLVLGGEGPIVATLLAAARRLDVPARPTSLGGSYSDHQAFADAGYPVGWLWAGDHPSLHTPRDTVAVIQGRQIARVGTVAWETLTRLRIG